MIVYSQVKSALLFPSQQPKSQSSPVKNRGRLLTFQRSLHSSYTSRPRAPPGGACLIWPPIPKSSPWLLDLSNHPLFLFDIAYIIVVPLVYSQVKWVLLSHAPLSLWALAVWQPVCNVLREDTRQPENNDDETTICSKDAAETIATTNAPPPLQQPRRSRSRSSGSSRSRSSSSRSSSKSPLSAAKVTLSSDEGESNWRGRQLTFKYERYIVVMLVDQGRRRGLLAYRPLFLLFLNRYEFLVIILIFCLI